MRTMSAPFLLAAGFLAALAAASPAHATGGMICKTANGSKVEISVGFGHVAGAPLIVTRLRVAGQVIPVIAPQWWLDDREMRLMLTDPEALNRLLTLHARRDGDHYDGHIEWRGARHWVRCRED